MSYEFLVELASLAASTHSVEQVGGKAANLGRLMAAGVRVPAGFVVTATGLTGFGEPDRPDRAQVLAAVIERASKLTAPLIVRSSASIEDGATAAPGLFATCRDVSIGELESALATVWRSAQAPAVAAYLEVHGLSPQDLRIAAIVQEQVAAAAAGVIYTETPGRPLTATIEAEVGGRLYAAEITGDDDVLTIDDPDFPLSSATTAAVLAAGRAAGSALAVLAADVEWCFTGTSDLWVVQARALPAAVIAEADRSPPRELFDFSRADPELVWRWDASHNPDPLSPAQAGLVALVDDAGLAPYRQRVVGGYLYATDPPLVPGPRDAAALRDDFERLLRPAMESALAPIEAAEPPTVATALAGFTKVYRDYASNLAPLLHAARHELVELVSTIGGEIDVERQVADLLGEGVGPQIPLGERRARVAAQSPGWDVSIPTYGEDARLLDHVLARYQASTPRSQRADRLSALRGQVPADQIADFDRILVTARLAHDIGEVDDWFYGRAQAGVRRALLGVARRWRIENPADIFLLPLELVTHQLADPPRDFGSRVASARERLAEQRRWAMPMAFCGGRPLPARRKLLPANCFAGRGTGARVIGTVVTPEDLAGSPELPVDPVLVARAVTPSMALLARGITAVVSDHGSLLGHGAAMARELGVPCVVGCSGASAHLARGDRVWVDGQAGLVVRIIPVP